jgi:hypothetical protein
VVQRSGNKSQKVYCGNACQAFPRRDTSTKRWPEYGEASIGTTRVHYFQQHLFDVQSGCCAICGDAAVWLGLPLTMAMDQGVGPGRWTRAMDHIDGNPTNNRRENLPLICPNCDSQLPT